MSRLSMALRGIAVQGPSNDIAFVLLTLEGIAKHLACSFRGIDRAAWQDLLQEAILKVWCSSAFRGQTEAEARAYLRTVLRNLALDYCRKNAAKATSASDEELWKTAEVPYAILQLEFVGALQLLSNHDENLLKEMDVMGMLPWTANSKKSEDELATAHGVSPNALQRRRSRLREKVKEFVTELFRQGTLDEFYAKVLSALCSEPRGKERA